jgi:hypothetical protein
VHSARARFKRPQHAMAAAISCNSPSNPRCSSLLERFQGHGGRRPSLGAQSSGGLSQGSGYSEAEDNAPKRERRPSFVVGGGGRLSFGQRMRAKVGYGGWGSRNSQHCSFAEESCSFPRGGGEMSPTERLRGHERSPMKPRWRPGLSTVGASCRNLPVGQSGLGEDSMTDPSTPPKTPRLSARPSVREIGRQVSAKSVMKTVAI